MNLGKTLQQFSITKPSGALNLLLLCAWGVIVVGYVEVSIRHLPIIGIFAPAFTPALFLLLIAISSTRIGHYIRPIDLVVYFLCIAVYLLQYVFFPQNGEILDEYIFRFFLRVLPFYYLGLILKIKEFDKPFYIVSMLIIWLVLFYIFIYKRAEEGMPTEEEVEEQMSIAYLTLPHVMYVIWHLFRKFSITGIITALAGTLFLFSCGTRGPLLCLFVFIALYVLLFNNWKRSIKIVVLLLFTAISVLIVVYLETILLTTFELSSQLGVSNRVFSLVESGEVVSHTSGRDQISAVLWRSVENGGLFGYGLGGSWHLVGMYSHNILLDFLISFGPLFGGVLFIALTWLLLKGFVKSKDIDKGFVLMLICCSFLKLFLSHIFLTESMLFLLIGYCVSILRNGKREKIQSLGKYHIYNGKRIQSSIGN